MKKLKLFLKACFPSVIKRYHIIKGDCVSTKRCLKNIITYFKYKKKLKTKFIRIKAVDNLIISITSFPARIDFFEYTLFSLIQQTTRPSKIILWLSEDEFAKAEKPIPESLAKYSEFNFEIRFVKENYRSYKKLVHCLTDFPNHIIVTADDDIYYPPNWLELLYKEHLAFPDDIIAHRVRTISFTGQKINLYNNWEGSKTDHSLCNFFTGAGGVLYPPDALYKDVLNTDLFLTLCPSADDIWFYVMAILKKTRIRKLKNGYDYAMDFDYIYDKKYLVVPKLTDQNISNNQNDAQLRAVLDYYNIYDSFYDFTTETTHDTTSN